MENRDFAALNVYVALCYYKLDYYDVSLEILNAYLAQVRATAAGRAAECRQQGVREGETERPSAAELGKHTGRPQGRQSQPLRQATAPSQPPSAAIPCSPLASTLTRRARSSARHRSLPSIASCPGGWRAQQPDSAVALNLKACNQFKLYDGKVSDATPRMSHLHAVQRWLAR